MPKQCPFLNIECIGESCSLFIHHPPEVLAGFDEATRLTISQDVCALVACANGVRQIYQRLLKTKTQ